LGIFTKLIENQGKKRVGRASLENAGAKEEFKSQVVNKGFQYKVSKKGNIWRDWVGGGP